MQSIMEIKPIKRLWRKMKNDFFTRNMVWLVSVLIAIPFALVGTTLFRSIGAVIMLTGFAAKLLASVPNSKKTDFLGRPRK